jgi:hypothetical protein
MLRLERIEQLQTVKPTTLQLNVEEYEIGAPCYDGRKCVVAVVRGTRTEAFVLQDAGNEFADIRFIVDDEDIG